MNNLKARRQPPAIRRIDGRWAVIVTARDGCETIDSFHKYGSDAAARACEIEAGPPLGFIRGVLWPFVLTVAAVVAFVLVYTWLTS
jgi:hypothetical protein